MTTSPDDPGMGLLPRVDGCDCHACRPEPDYPPYDRSTIDAVLRNGWQVLLVGTGACECGDECGDGDGPAFAYTLGLGHRAGHPELVISGLEPGLMHRALNHLAQRVLDGHRCEAGDIVEGVLGGVPVVLERASATGLDETATWSGWFHRRQPDALVVVWPTTSGVFAWQPGAPDVLDELQPVRWREPITHGGPLTLDPEWPFPVPPDATVLSCRHVVEEAHPVLFVARQRADERGEDWTLHCGDGHTLDQMTVIHLSHLVRGAPSIRDLSALPLEWVAERSDVDSEWTPMPIQEE
jgi:hypothetical protein